MNATDNRAKSIFLNAVEIATPEERWRFIETQCGGDASLRAEVEDLLGHQQLLGSFLESPAEGLAERTDLWPFAALPGSIIGPYKLLEQVGVGGMGVVFMAEQTEPIQRTVALKIIKPGMDTRQVVARFEAERQALALMDHPNIAKVLDAGMTDCGRPYFVMELVKGVPITQYCDDMQLSLLDRLELFKTVCEAVQHAHQKGIIHRDLKPANVLVAEYDNRSVPKVIDFGVAKATAQKLAARTMVTEYGQVIGTIEYMSPEQAKLNQPDIDTRSDVYSLGVLLYELLTGSTPFERERLRSAALDEVLRIIRDEEPPKPSVRLSDLRTACDSSSLVGTVGERKIPSLISIAANRDTEPARLNQDVSGELDWIVMKALEKDRNRRYETAYGFSADIDRHLRNEPVEAGPPSAVYRFRKFARRNRAAILAASLVTVALFLGLFGTTWQAIRATHAERVAQVQRDRAVEAEKRARTEAAVAQAVSDFLRRDLLGQASPYIPYDKFDESRGELKLVTVLDRAAGQLENRFADQPLVEAALRHTVGYIYLVFDDQGSRAQLHLRRAVDLRQVHLGDEHPDTLASKHFFALAKSDPALLSDVLNARRRVLGNHDPNTMYTMFSLAMAARESGDTARAIRLFRETLQAQCLALGEDDTQTAFTMHCLAHTLVMHAQKVGVPSADDREIETLYRQALSVYHAKGAETWQTYDITVRLGEFLNSSRRHEEAEALLQDSLQRLRSLPGASPEKAAEVANGLESVYRDWGKPERITELNRQRSGDKINRDFVREQESFSQAITLQPDRWEGWSGRASANFRLRLWDNAIADYSKAIELAPDVHTNWLHRGHSYLQLAQWDKAAADFTRVIEGWPHDPGGWFFRACAYAQLKQADKATHDLRQAVVEGFKDIAHLKSQPMLDPLRSSEEFKQLLAELEAKPM